MVEVWEPNQAVDQGCPVLNKTRTISGVAGVCGAELRWNMQTLDGRPYDLDQTAGSESFDSISADDESITAGVRFAGVCGTDLIAEVEAEIIDGPNGIVRFGLPDEVCKFPGLYRMSVAALEDGAPIAIDEGLLSIEPSLWATNDNNIPRPGGPTLKEIRMLLRDFPRENLLLRDYEFDVQEILSAIGWAVMDWNEQPPKVCQYSCATFPWRRQWMEGVLYQLLEISAHSYARNDAKGPANLLVNDQQKMQEYLGLAQIHFKRWREFCLRKKIELNHGIWEVG